jgi:hypothetical protein
MVGCANELSVGHLQFIHIGPDVSDIRINIDCKA